MKFFSGFCLENEEIFFKEFLYEDKFSVAGFSKGAILAFEYVKDAKFRIDKLQLFSPAFFQDKEEKFKRAQTIFFVKDQDKYIENFLKNVSYPAKIDLKNHLKKESKKELERLLNYVWKKEELEKIAKRGVLIEVYLGEKDKIIDSKKAKEFFKEFATVYYIKNRGHLLKGA